MIRVPRKERSVRWGGLVICLLIATAFCLSSVRALFWISPSGQYTFELHLGAVFFTWWSNAAPTPFPAGLRGWNIASISGAPALAFYPWLPWWHSSSSLKRLVIPLWMPFVAFAVPTAVLWYRCWRERHRIPAGHCQKCGYDLTGNVTGQCPECGHVIRQ